MNGGLLWVNKDSTSTHLSRSSKAETARIRAHVQHLSIQSRTRRKSAPPLRTTRKGSKSASDHQRPALPLRLATGVKKESRDEDEEARPPPERGQDTRVSAASALSWLPAASAEEKRSFLFFLRRTAQEWSGYRDVSIGPRVAKGVF